jgi:4-carboxymuconolactone decarboxylase
VVDLTHAFLDRRDVGDEEYACGVKLLGEQALVELTTLVGYYSTLATQMQLFRVPLPPSASPAFA